MLEHHKQAKSCYVAKIGGKCLSILCRKKVSKKKPNYAEKNASIIGKGLHP